MLNELLSNYRPAFLTTIVYMLQSVEYDTSAYLKWLWRTKDFGTVMHRRQLERTKPARLLLLAVKTGATIQILAGFSLVYFGLSGAGSLAWLSGLTLLVSWPLVWSHLIVLPLILGRVFISQPAKRKKIAGSEQVFANHAARKIAIVGSYGKTTMKEILLTVLGEGLEVAATPANKNVAVSHAVFALKLRGNEDVLIIEYGEGQPGDVEQFAQITHPTHAVITGVAPAHLDKYPSLKAAAQDIFSVAEYVDHNKLYVNADSPETAPFVKKDFQKFNQKGALGWRVTEAETSLGGTSFCLSKGKQKISLQSQLVGLHQVGFLAFAAALALDFGLTPQQVQAGISKTVPFEHRMQPYELAGAWIVDDTYNGNLEGIRAGTQLLGQLDATRKVYVTPGLVDQGVDSAKIHNQVGKLIAAANPDVVILMKNSVTKFIQSGLKVGKFKGKLQIVDDPLEFYANLKHFVAQGDLVVMQNDWTDNYA